MSGNSSLLLWLLAFVVAFLGAYLFVGWVRRAQAVEGALRARSGQLALAAGALGVALPAAMVLTLAAARLPFALGYSWLWVLPLFTLPALACLLPAWALSRTPRWPLLLASAAALAVVALATQAGWVLAAGFRPGLRWQPLLLAASAGTALVGFAAALFMAHSEAGRDGRRSLWRLAAAGAMALALVLGQELLAAAAAVVSQIGSIHARAVPAVWLTVVAGGLIPSLLALMALDLALRNRVDRLNRRRGASVQLNLPQRRKRRRKYRAL